MMDKKEATHAWNTYFLTGGTEIKEVKTKKKKKKQCVRIKKNGSEKTIQKIGQ